MNHLGVRVDGPPGAPVLLLANSLGTSAALWDRQLPVLAQRFRVVRYEHRGHGGTPAPPGPYSIADLGADALTVLEGVGAQRASLVGVSLGGMVCMWLAAHHPERVDGLVLACTAPHLPPPESWQQRAATVRAQGTGVLLDALLGRWFTPGFVAAHPEVAQLVAAMLEATAPEGYAGCCEAIAAMDQWPDIGAITAPALLIAGADDPVTPPSGALRLQAAIPGAGLSVVAGASHLANLEQAERFTQLVTDHLLGTASARGRDTRRAVLGDAHVQRSEAGATPFSASWVDYVTRVAWGEIWTRPGLDRRTRSCITVALLAGLGRSDELALHVRGARRNGVSEAELAEVLLHTAVYAGAPAANSAFAVARAVLEAGDG